MAKRPAKAAPAKGTKTNDAPKARSSGRGKKPASEDPAAAGPEKAPTTGAGEGAASGPVLYGQPVPLTPQRHAKLRLSPDRNYAIAAEVNSVPINAIEYRHALKHYPIVFSAGATSMSIALMGLSEGENLFVDAEGAWAPEHYVPAYVRRHPFIFMAGPDRQQYVLCVDEAASCVGKKGEAFFKKGEPTDVTQRALSFCSSYQTQSEVTREFVAALDANALLVPNRAEINTAGGETLRLGGFRVIDEKRFNDLPNDTFLDWRRRGWLPHIYAHLLSMSNWSSLIARRNAQA